MLCFAMKRFLLVVWTVTSLTTVVKAACSSSQFTCRNGTCIRNILVCDKNNDCGDGSDEVQCTCYLGDIRLYGGSSQGTVLLCGLNQFIPICDTAWGPNEAKVTCNQLGYTRGTAVNGSYFSTPSSVSMWYGIGGCTGNETTLYSCPGSGNNMTCDISSHSARAICSYPKCTSSQFSCNNGFCTSSDNVCNGYNDCGDNSDEVKCECTSSQFSCNNGFCTSSNNVCNGYNNCGDNSDEVKCGCSSSQFRCNNGFCTSSDNVCNGYNDCGDNSDEVKCVCTRGSIRLEGANSLAAGTISVCYNNSWRGVCDSTWSSAESSVLCKQLGYYSISKTYSGSYFGKGSSGSTISITYNCYGYENRLSSCRQSVPVLNTCTNSHLAGIRCTCEQNNKILHACTGYSQFLCSNGKCIDDSYECDGKDNCGDNSDEYCSAGETSSRIAALSIGTPIVFFSLITVVALIVILCKRHKCFKTCRVPTRQATELELDPVEDLPPYSVSEVYPDRALLYPDTAITGCVYPHPAKIYPQAYSGPCVPLEYPPHPAAK